MLSDDRVRNIPRSPIFGDEAARLCLGRPLRCGGRPSNKFPKVRTALKTLAIGAPSQASVKGMDRPRLIVRLGAAVGVQNTGRAFDRPWLALPTEVSTSSYGSNSCPGPCGEGTRCCNDEIKGVGGQRRRGGVGSSPV